MGERAQIYFTDGRKIGPGIYLHWNGPDVAELLLETKNHMKGREGDLDYTTARFIGICHEAIPGNLSLGVSNAQSDGWWNHSPGDAGAFLVNVNTWTVECADGYGFATDAAGGDYHRKAPAVLPWAEVMRVAARATRARGPHVNREMSNPDSMLLARFEDERTRALAEQAKKEEETKQKSA